MKKYRMKKEGKLYRIFANRSFGLVEKGERGGLIERESNLSQDGNAWVCENAQVHDNAYVYGDAQIGENACVYDNAQVCGDAYIRENSRICGYAKVYENAYVYGNATICDGARIFGHANVSGNVQVYNNAYVHGDAHIYGDARICEYAQIYGKAKVQGDARICEYARIYGKAKVHGDAYVYGNAQIHGNAQVYGDAKIYGSAIVHGSAHVYGDAKIYGSAIVQYGCLEHDILLNIKQYISSSLNIFPTKNKYILYKRVKSTKDKNIFSSLQDPSFKYEIGKISEEKNYNKDKLESCTGGIHVSTPFYWKGGDTLIAVEVKMSDIITCMEGKIRAKRVKTLEVIETY